MDYDVFSFNDLNYRGEINDVEDFKKRVLVYMLEIWVENWVENLHPKFERFKFKFNISTTVLQFSSFLTEVYPRIQSASFDEQIVSQHCDKSNNDVHQRHIEHHWSTWIPDFEVIHRHYETAKVSFCYL